MLNNQEISAPVLIKDLGVMPISYGSKHRKRFGIYKCSCGNEFSTTVAGVKNGNCKSCGCYNKQRSKEVNTTHGLRHHLLYGIWTDISYRTTNEKQISYKYYGGRGIIMCKEWRNDFKSFYDWCISNGWAKGLEIDRRDNDGNYEPSNCRFVTRSINTSNTRVIKSNNTSGYRGVSFHKQHKKWQAYISVNNKRKHLGLFNTAFDAAIAYDAYVIENNLEHTTNGLI